MNKKSLVEVSAAALRLHVQRDFAKKAAALKAAKLKAAKLKSKKAKLLSKIEVVERTGKRFATLWQMDARRQNFQEREICTDRPSGSRPRSTAFWKPRFPIKPHLGDDKHAPEPWRRKSPGRYGKARRAKSVPTRPRRRSSKQLDEAAS